MERYCKKVNQHLLKYKATTGLPEQIILEPAQHYITRDAENPYCLGLNQKSVRDVRKAITKARMLTGTYMLQTLKSKFYQAEVDPTCPICRLETETMTHVITSCPVYNEIWKEHFVKIKGTVITAIGFDS
jgi:hypothetical protein